MSNISTIIDAFRTRVATVLPSHKELVHVANIEENNELFLCQGQALSFGPGENSQRSLSCKLSVNRTVIVTITRAVSGVEMDTAARVATTKALFEDQLLVINDVEKDPTLSSATAKINYISDNGIEEVFAGTSHFLMVQSTFAFEYFETLS